MFQITIMIKFQIQQRPRITKEFISATTLPNAGVDLTEIPAYRQQLIENFLFYFEIVLFSLSRKILSLAFAGLCIKIISVALI